MADDDAHPYAPSLNGSRLYQCEVLSGIVERPVKWLRRSETSDEFGYDEVVHPYVVLVTQDCDLEQDARARDDKDSVDAAKRDKGVLPTILLVVASEFDKVKFDGSDIRKRVRQNKDERYQYLASISNAHDALSEGVPPLILDFKRFFTYSTSELLLAIERSEAKRRARLVTPYAEHLSSRFGYFVQRIGLPRDHHDLESTLPVQPVGSRQ